MQYSRELITLAIRGENGDAFAGRDAMTMQQSLCGRAGHHTRQIIVAEHRRLLDHAGGKDHGARAHLVMRVGSTSATQWSA